jgi:hypothetical protein
MIISFINIIGRQAGIFFNEEDQKYTLFLLEEGGPIVSNRSLEMAKREFQDMLLLNEATQKLQYFAEHGTFKGIIQ